MAMTMPPAPALLSPRYLGTTSYYQPAIATTAPVPMGQSPLGRPQAYMQAPLSLAAQLGGAAGTATAPVPGRSASPGQSVLTSSSGRGAVLKNLSAIALPQDGGYRQQAHSSPALAAVGGMGGLPTVLSPRDAIPSGAGLLQTMSASGGVANVIRTLPAPGQTLTVAVPSATAGVAQDAIRWANQPRRSAPAGTTQVVVAKAPPPAKEVPSPRPSVGTGGSAAPASRPSSAKRYEERRRPNCHADLYEDAFERKKRLESLKEHVDQATEREEHMRQLQHNEELRQRRRFYRVKDKRSHLEREQDAMRKKKEKLEALEAEQRARAEQEFAKCTFKPSLVKKPPRDPGFGEPRGGAAGGAARSRSPSPQGAGSAGQLEASKTVLEADMRNKLKELIDRQRLASEGWRALAAEDTKLRERLREAHAKLYDKILREETQRVVALLQEAHDEKSEGSTAQKELVRRVRGMVAQGGNLESAQKMIVDELVGQSQEEVQRRVLEAFLPLRFEAEGGLYTRRLAFVHELEATEAQAMSLKGGTLCNEARAMGFEFGLADQCRRLLSTARGVGSVIKSVSSNMLPVHGHLGGTESPRSMASFGGFSAVVGPRQVSGNATVFGMPVLPIGVGSAVYAASIGSGAPSGRMTPRSQVVVSPRKSQSEVGSYTTAQVQAVGSPRGAAGGQTPLTPGAPGSPGEALPATSMLSYGSGAQAVGSVLRSSPASPRHGSGVEAARAAALDAAMSAAMLPEGPPPAAPSMPAVPKLRALTALSPLPFGTAFATSTAPSVRSVSSGAGAGPPAPTMTVLSSGVGTPRVVVGTPRGAATPVYPASPGTPGAPAPLVTTVISPNLVPAPSFESRLRQGL